MIKQQQQRTLFFTSVQCTCTTCRIVLAQASAIVPTQLFLPAKLHSIPWPDGRDVSCGGWGEDNCGTDGKRKVSVCVCVCVCVCVLYV